MTPRRVKIGKNYFEPATLRYDVLKELEGQVIYVPSGAKTASPQGITEPGDDEAIDLIPLFKKVWNPDLGISLKFNPDDTSLSVILTRNIDGEATLLDAINIGRHKGLEKHTITAHMLLAEMVQLLLKQFKGKRNEEVSTADPGHHDASGGGSQLSLPPACSPSGSPEGKAGASVDPGGSGEAAASDAGSGIRDDEGETNRPS